VKHPNRKQRSEKPEINLYACVKPFPRCQILPLPDIYTCVNNLDVKISVVICRRT
jgi:hypothetical protein